VLGRGGQLRRMRADVREIEEGRDRKRADLLELEEGCVGVEQGSRR
jgi:hypothetical protein